MQSCLLRLYVDPALRRLLALDPDAALRSYELTEDERASVLAVPVERYELFGQSLFNKRMRGLRSMYPRLDALQDPTVGRLMRRYVTTMPPPDMEVDARRLGAFLEEALVQLEAPAVVLDVLRYERIVGAVTRAANEPWLRVPVPGPEDDTQRPQMLPHVAVQRFETFVPDMAPRACVIVFVGQPGWNPPLEFESDETTERLLLACDGCSSIGRIVATEAERGTDPQAVREALQTLHASGLIACWPPPVAAARPPARAAEGE